MDGQRALVSRVIAILVHVVEELGDLDLPGLGTDARHRAGHDHQHVRGGDEVRREHGAGSADRCAGGAREAVGVYGAARA